jgi:hypothetical protein
MIQTQYMIGYARYLSPAALAGVLFFVFSLNTQTGAMNTLINGRDVAHKVNAASPYTAGSLPENMRVLAPKDSDLYRAAFTAQAIGDWISADNALALVADRRLIGHVMADRYSRRPASSEELKLWLTNYRNLPEAQDIYSRAVKLGASKGAFLPKPMSAEALKAGGAADSTGFETSTSAFRRVWMTGIKAWRNGDMAGAAQVFSKLANQKKLSSWDRAAAEFWTYRALKRSGDTEHAYGWLRAAADQPHSFYGMLANNLLGRDGNAAWHVPNFDAHMKATLGVVPSGWRALALIQIGKIDLAEAELRRINPQGRRGVQQAMLALANLVPMPSLAMRLGSLAANDNGDLYDTALYPVPVWQPTGGFDIDRALIYAVMRHESNFDPKAVSERGACGLMQLMPSTARSVANDTRGLGSCSVRMMDPAINLALGQGYVQSLAAQPKIGDSLLLMLAAYNGGPNRAAKWLNDTTRRDPLLFIESLPVRETRDYVQQVMVHYVIYRARLGQPMTPLMQLANGEWPRYSLNDDLRPARQRDASSGSIKVASN